MTLKELIEQGYVVAPERYSQLTFLHRGEERIFYDLVKEKEILRYISIDTSIKSDWEELQRRLAELAR